MAAERGDKGGTSKAGGVPGERASSESPGATAAPKPAPGDNADPPPRDPPPAPEPPTPLDVPGLLRFAFKADVNTPEGKAALKAAEAAALREARDLQRNARILGGAQAAELERRAKDALFHAVLAKELPKVAGKLADRVGNPRVPKPPPAPSPLLLTAPGVPTEVAAQAGLASATVRWTAPAGLVTSYVVTSYIGTAAQPIPTVTAGTLTQATVLGLTPGTGYRFTVKATNPLGTSSESAFSNTVTPTGAPLDGAPIELDLPAFSSDPTLLIDPAADAARGLLAAATEAGTKWRYEHLKTLAIAAAKDTLQFEQQIASVMAMALDKLGTAEQLLGNTLLEAASRLQTTEQQVADAAAAPQIDELIEPLGDLAAQSLLLPRFFAWLIEVGPLNFWIGLFEAMINDLAAVVPFFGDATDFGRTKKFLGEAFSDDVDGVRTAIRDAVQSVLDRLDTDVADMIAPLRAAVAQVIAGTRKAMADVFEASDLVLLMTPAQTAGAPDVPDLDPFADLYERLEAQVEQLAEQIKARIRSALQPLLSSGSDLFVVLVITFVAIPLLAFLVIALAGGPFSAALLAAVVLLAAEELLRLLVRWLSGPLLRKVDDAKRQVTELVGQLQSFFALQASLVSNQSPEVLLKIVASQLRQITDFVPQDFLEDTTAVLEEARNVVLRTATQLGLSAEQALGMENATAFDAIKLDYARRLVSAPQLPGGRDPARLAGAALLRDLGRLDEQRTALQDGKEVVFTHRLSLLNLLGNDSATFQQFVQRRELVLDLDPRELLDRTFPGVYRAIIQDVQLTGVFPDSLVPNALRGIPVRVTHLGESRTRIRRNANPAAPPLTLPDCFPKTAQEFVDAVVGDGALREELKRIFATFPLLTIGEYAMALFLLILFGVPDPVEVITNRFKRACRDHLPEALARAATEASCELVDGEVLVVGVRALLDPVRFSDALADVLIPPDAANRLGEKPDLNAAAAAVADLLQANVTTGGVVTPGLVQVAREAYDGAVTAFMPHIAKWGDATLVEDPDPQVRALGFTTLIRRLPPETAVFNLFPRRSASSVVAGSSAPEGAAALAPTQSLQYRPFENRGLGGKLLVRLESVGDDPLLNQLSGALIDLVLDVTIKACFDDNLAQTVRSSRSQSAAGMGVVDQLAGSVNVPLPGAMTSVKAGASELRTVHYSLRAHRDKTLQTWAAALQAAASASTSIAGLLAGKAPLGRDVPFQPLTTVDAFTLELTPAAPANTEAWLLDLAGLIRVTPDDLGFASSVLDGREVLEKASLVGLGVAVIPMPNGVRSETDELSVDPLGVKLTVPAPLNAVLAGFTTATAFPQRLKVASVAANAPTLAEIFAATTPPAIEVAFGEGIVAAQKVYDVVFSLMFRVPTLQVATPAAALL